jgi:hypothetical protein
MFLELFVLGGFWFWCLFVGLLVLLELSTAAESHWGFAWLLLFCGVLWLFGNANPFAWFWQNPITVLIYAGIYLSIGLPWGIAKWFFHLKNVRDSLNPRLDLLRVEYNSKKQADQTFQQYLEYWNYIPVARKNKNQISVWMMWWPFSMAYTFFADIVRRFYHWVMDQYIVVFDKINNAVFGDLK